MYSPNHPQTDDVDELMRNAELRNDLEPFFDESISLLERAKLPTREENEFLSSILAWERAPTVPIADWFEPRLELPTPGSLSDQQLRPLLRETIDRLFARHIVLDFTDHLSDRELYLLVYRDILPTHEKCINDRSHYLHWDCANMGEDPEVWLRYYATPEEREQWAEFSSGALPPIEAPPYPRRLPRPGM
jgi:hypothetical protein